MFIKMSLSVLACAAVAAAQTAAAAPTQVSEVASAPTADFVDYGLTPAQSKAIIEAESPFVSSLENNPTFTEFESILAAATSGPIASYVNSLEAAFTLFPTASEPAFIESLAAQAAAGISVFPTAVLPFIKSAETAAVQLLDEALSTSVDIGGIPATATSGSVTPPLVKSSSIATLKVSTSTVTGKAATATESTSTSGSSSGSSTATSSSPKASSGAGTVEGVRAVLGGVVAFGAAVLIL